MRMVALIALCLMVLSACSSEQVVTVPVVEYVSPPEVLLRDCDSPQLDGDTYRAAVILAVQRGAAIDQCNADKRKLRQWSAQVQDGESDE